MILRMSKYETEVANSDDLIYTDSDLSGYTGYRCKSIFPFETRS
jgi:hypothetical protein